MNPTVPTLENLTLFDDLPPSYEEVVRVPTYADATCQIYSPNNIILNTAANVRHGTGRPTVTPATNFDPEYDACYLRTALMSGSCKYEIIKILCHRTVVQRLAIADFYYQRFGTSLNSDIRKNKTDYFRNVVTALLQKPEIYMAHELHRAVYGDRDSLCEMMAYLSFDEINAVKSAYLNVYNESVESGLQRYIIDQDFLIALKKLLETKRDQSDALNYTLIQNDVYHFITRESRPVSEDLVNFNCLNILCSRSRNHIKIMAVEFERIRGYSLVKMIENNFAYYVEELFSCIVHYSLNRNVFFAIRLKISMEISVNEEQLVRIILSRSEIDLKDIMIEFKKLSYGHSLKDEIRKHTSGYFKYILYELIGEPRNCSIWRYKYRVPVESLQRHTPDSIITAVTQINRGWNTSVNYIHEITN